RGLPCRESSDSLRRFQVQLVRYRHSMRQQWRPESLAGLPARGSWRLPTTRHLKTKAKDKRADLKFESSLEVPLICAEELTAEQALHARKGSFLMQMD